MKGSTRMAELPVLPIKTDALIADTTHMSAEEMGVYVRLLIAMSIRPVNPSLKTRRSLASSG